MIKHGFIFFCIFLPSMAYTTPNAAIWEREVLLGFDDQSYYCLNIKKDQPGSHYQDTDYLSFQHFKNNGDLLASTLIRETSNTIEPGEGKEKEKHQEKPVKAFNLQGFLQKHKVQLAFPSTGMDDIKTIFTEKGMFVEKNKRKVLLLNATFLDKFFGDYKNKLSDHFKLVGYFEGSQWKTGYFLIQLGWGAGDADFIQKIVPVNKTEIEPIFDKFYFTDKKLN